MLIIFKPKVVRQALNKLKGTRGRKSINAGVLEGLIRQGIGPWELTANQQKKNRSAVDQSKWSEIGKSFDKYFDSNDEFILDFNSFKKVLFFSKA